MNRGKRDATYRERWIDAVLWTDELTPMTKNLLLAMSRHMDDRGRVRRKHADLAAALQIQNPKHVGDRIREAREKGFLGHIEGTGYNRTVTAYDAMIPVKARANAPQSPRAAVQVPRNGGPENGGPEQAWDEQFRSPKTGDHYARAVSNKNRERESVPDGSRAESAERRSSLARPSSALLDGRPSGEDARPARTHVAPEHDATSQAGNNRGWVPTPSRRLSLDTTEGEVA